MMPADMVSECCRSGCEGLEQKPEIVRTSSRLKRTSHQISKIACIIGAAMVAYYLISHYILQSVCVVGSSMSPTLKDSDAYLLNRWVYVVRDPRPGDIVVLRDPSDGGLAVKRIIATPGQKVSLKKGDVYVDGNKLSETYLPRAVSTFPSSEASAYTCGSKQYFVLGDNRNNSVDSRVYGPVPRQNIMGMIVR